MKLHSIFIGIGRSLTVSFFDHQVVSSKVFLGMEFPSSIKLGIQSIPVLLDIFTESLKEIIFLGLTVLNIS